MKRIAPCMAVVALLIVTVTAPMLAGSNAAKKDAIGVAVVNASDSNSMRVEGEKRYHANCGRCHAAPQKFPPRMMATVLRHMRVRATITDEDRRLILFYMTQ